MPPNQRPNHQRQYQQLLSSDFKLEAELDFDIDVDPRDTEAQVESTNTSEVTNTRTSSLNMLRKSISTMFLGSNRTRSTRKKRVDIETEEDGKTEAAAYPSSIPKTPTKTSTTNMENEKEKNVKRSKSKLFGLLGRTRGTEQRTERNRVIGRGMGCVGDFSDLGDAACIGDLDGLGEEEDRGRKEMKKSMKERMWSRMSGAEKSEDENENEGDEDDYGVERDSNMYWSRGSSSHQTQAIRQSLYLDSSSEDDVDAEEEEFQSLVADPMETILNMRTRLTLAYRPFLSLIPIIREGLGFPSESVTPDPIHVNILDFPITSFIQHYQGLYQMPTFLPEFGPDVQRTDDGQVPSSRQSLIREAEWDAVRRIIAVAHCARMGGRSYTCEFLSVHIHSRYLRIETDLVQDGDCYIFDNVEEKIRIPTILQFCWDEPRVTLGTPSKSKPGSEDDNHTEIAEPVDICTVFSLLTHILRSDLSPSPGTSTNASSSHDSNTSSTSIDTAHFYTHAHALSITIHAYSFASSLSGASVPTSAWINVLNCFQELIAVDVHGVDCEVVGESTGNGEIFTAKASYHRFLDALAYTDGVLEGAGDNVARRMLCPRLEKICMFGFDFDEPFGLNSGSTSTSGPGADPNLPRKASFSSFNLPSLFNSKPKPESTGILKPLLAILAFRAHNLGRDLRQFEICNGFGLTRERIAVLETCLLGVEEVMFTEEDLDAKIYESCRADLNADVLEWKDVNGVLRMFGLSEVEAVIAMRNMVFPKSNSNVTANSTTNELGHAQELNDFSSMAESDSASKIDTYAYGYESGHENDDDIDDDVTLADSGYDSEAMYA